MIKKRKITNKKVDKTTKKMADNIKKRKYLPAFQIINIKSGIKDPHVIAVRISFFLYCNFEQITGTTL